MVRPSGLIIFLLWGCLPLGYSTTKLPNSQEKPSPQQNPMDWMRNFTTNKMNSTFNTAKLPNVNFKEFASSLTSPKVSKFGYGVIMGYSSGICLKKVSKTAAVVIGGLFLAIQSLSSRGYLHIDHNRIRQDLEVRIHLLVTVLIRHGSDSARL
jgi:uncharacterized membrane protein (Fun14 family)